VTDDAHGGIVGKTKPESLVCLVAAVGDGDEPGVLAVSHADAAAVMEAHPGGSAGDAGGEVEQSPVGDGIGAIEHGFGFAVGAGDGTGVEVIAADDDGGGDGSFAHHLVEEQAGLIALAIAEPADAGGQTLEGNLIGGEAEPFLQAEVVGEELEQGGVGPGDVLRVAREGNPAERPAAFAEGIADEGGDEAGVGEGIVDACYFGLCAQVVAVVEGDGSAALQRLTRCRYSAGAALRSAFRSSSACEGGR
jgi:hypothetical protein